MHDEETQEHLDEVMFEGPETPWLLRKPVVGGVVAVFAVTVVLYFLATQFWGVSFKIDAEPFRDWVEARGALGVVVFILVMAASVLFAPIPNIPIFIAAGLAWGPVLGTTYCMAGLTLGSAAAFGIARRFGRKFLPRLIGEKAAARLDHMVDTMGGRVVFWTRIMPGVNFDWISFVAGMTSVRFRVFIFYSFLGMIPPCATTVVMGDGLNRDPRITLAMGGLWVAAILATAAYFWTRRKHWAGPVPVIAESGVNPEAELG
jgi:uncharacterized membrane protein YdjX (TVP38/TMEM64 family)